MGRPWAVVVPPLRRGGGSTTCTLLAAGGGAKPVPLAAKLSTDRRGTDGRGAFFRSFLAARLSTDWRAARPEEVGEVGLLPFSASPLLPLLPLLVLTKPRSLASCMLFGTFGSSSMFDRNCWRCAASSGLLRPWLGPSVFTSKKALSSCTGLNSVDSPLLPPGLLVVVGEERQVGRGSDSAPYFCASASVKGPSGGRTCKLLSRAMVLNSSSLALSRRASSSESSYPSPPNATTPRAPPSKGGAIEEDK